MSVSPFLLFLYHLRTHGVPAGTQEWLTLMQALARGHARAHLGTFYHLARAILVHHEAQFDRFDQAFATFFEGLEDQFDIDENLAKWLQDPVLPRELTEEERAALQHLDLDALRAAFEERLREQKERHDGGNHWIGTGGTSPFGSGGTHPTGMRIGAGGGRSAVMVASERRFRNLRSDRVLNTRQIGSALRRLRRLAKEGGPEELDLDRTIEKTARDGGEIDLVFGPSRRNRIKLLLLMDVGGSMDPWADLSERLFSAAHAASHFKAFRTYYFHNCVYDQLYEDMYQARGPATEEVLRDIDETWTLVIVGDAYMHPWELTQPTGLLHRATTHRGRAGIDWLRELRRTVPNSVWLNPESERIWGAPSISLVRGIFPMFCLTLDGLTEAVDMLRGLRANRPVTPTVDNPWAHRGM
jgi:uncharacterized protein with von Willebrand factor type A (vWA) domain